MRAILIAFLLASTGCAVSLWPPELAFGGSSIKSDCHKSGHCDRVTESMPVGSELLGWLLSLVDAVPGVDATAQPATAAAEPVHHTHPAEEPRIEWETGGLDITETPATIVFDSY
jgi:hypothetical protein